MPVNGISIDELPEKYQKYKERIAKLRSYGLGIEEKTTYEELIEWLETHDGQMPRGHIKKNGKKISVDEMTKEEQVEKNLYQRWRNSTERKVLDACIRKIY